MLGPEGLNGRNFIVLFVILCLRNMNAISIDAAQPEIQGDTGYVGKNLTLTCSGDVGQTGSLEYYFPDHKTMIVPPHILEDMYLDENTTTAERQLTFTALEKVNDKLRVGCFVRKPKNRKIGKRCDATTLCTTTTIKVFYGPQPPQMNVTFDSPPSTSLMGSLLEATCTANVGEAQLDGHLVWIMVTNGQNIYPQDYTEEEVGVTIHQKKKTTTEGDIITSTLTIPQLTHRHDDLVLLCFSHLGVRHVLVGCPQGDELCVQSRPLHVKIRVVMFFTAGIMVVLAVTIWFSVTKDNSETDDQEAEVVVAVNTIEDPASMEEDVKVKRQKRRSIKKKKTKKRAKSKRARHNGKTKFKTLAKPSGKLEGRESDLVYDDDDDDDEEEDNSEVTT